MLKNFDEGEKASFWKGLHDKADKVAIAEHVTSYIASKTTEYVDKSASSKYMPLKYYTKKGFPAWRIKQFCHDKQFSAVGGWLYAIDIDSKTSGVRGEKETGNRDEGRTGRQPPENDMPTPSSGGCKDKEKSVKAVAAQKEKNASEAGKILAKIAAVKFALDHLLKQTGIEQMPPFALLPAQETKKKLDEMQTNAQHCVKKGTGLEFNVKDATTEADKATKSVSFLRGLLIAAKAHKL
jgi:hypothetical protein